MYGFSGATKRGIITNEKMLDHTLLALRKLMGLQRCSLSEHLANQESITLESELDVNLFLAN